MADYSDDHIGKRVVTHGGVEIGTVEDIRNGDMYVSVTTDSTNETVDELGWEGPVEQDVHHLRDQYISTITENTVRLGV
ncbi:hypothetical protein [Halorussus aquaticus]|uniref:DUF2171 domain-containing protein n=1 Tax=Halorussus aquaticus TaxID=2953748 RepID=A0ABD5Q5U8_9EURY|nr:hypothetical protein [Halorussus aquaticus]